MTHHDELGSNSLPAVPTYFNRKKLTPFWRYLHYVALLALCFMKQVKAAVLVLVFCGLAAVTVVIIWCVDVESDVVALTGTNPQCLPPARVDCADYAARVDDGSKWCEMEVDGAFAHQYCSECQMCEEPFHTKQKNVQRGWKVLTYDATGNSLFTDVVANVETETGTFKTLVTSSGKTLPASDSHWFYDVDGDTIAVYDVTVGTQVEVIGAFGPVLEEVVAIETRNATVGTLLTKAGNYIANGFRVSSFGSGYNDMDEEDLVAEIHMLDQRIEKRGMNNAQASLYAYDALSRFSSNVVILDNEHAETWMKTNGIAPADFSMDDCSDGLGETCPGLDNLMKSPEFSAKALPGTSL